MSIFDEYSGNISELRDNLSRVTKKIKDNSREIKRKTSLTLELNKEQRELKSLYEELGIIEYEYLKNSKAKSETQLYSLVEQIDIRLARIESIKLKLGNVASSTPYSSILEDENKKEDIIYFDEGDLK